MLLNRCENERVLVGAVRDLGGVASRVCCGSVASDSVRSAEAAR